MRESGRIVWTVLRLRQRRMALDQEILVRMCPREAREGRHALGRDVIAVCGEFDDDYRIGEAPQGGRAIDAPGDEQERDACRQPQQETEEVRATALGQIGDVRPRGLAAPESGVPVACVNVRCPSCYPYRSLRRAARTG